MKAVLTLAVAAFAFMVRFLLIGTIENDHYVYLARAHQVLYGDWPVRNFADPGTPLAYLLSAAAAALAGPTLLTEAVLTAFLFAIGAAATFVLTRRAAGSTIIGLVGTAIVLAVPPRLYNSSKMMVLVIAIVLGWRYADRPSTARAVALGGWTGVAFLFRHDYAVYVSIAAALLLLVRHWGEWTRLFGALTASAGMTLAVIAPWLIYVELQQGLPEYLASAMRFSLAERNRTIAAWPAIFYATASVPLLALVLNWRGTRYVTAAQVAFAATLVLTSELVLLRDAPAARLPDVVAATVVMAAIIAGRFLPRRTKDPQATPPIILAAAIVTATGIAVIAGRVSIVSAVDQVITRWQHVVTRLHDATFDIIPTPQHAGLVRFIDRCTGPDERVLVSGFAPELPVLAHRPFAAGLPDWIPGYYEHPADVARARAQLGQERVAIAVMLDGGERFTSSWPAVADDLRARGLTRYDLPLAQDHVEVWLRAGATRDAETGLPCGG